MDFEEMENFMLELDNMMNEFSFYILDECNSTYDDPFLSDEKVISAMQCLEDMLSIKISMQIAKLKFELKEKKENKKS